MFFFSSSPSKSEPLNLAIHIEPTYIAHSYNHFVVGFNNRAWFYSMANESRIKMKISYFATIVFLCLFLFS